MSDNYEIHSLHINVGNGDGAIHLLVEPGTPNKVHRAILVDGGKTTAVDQIQRTIRYIEDTYQFVDLNGTPQLDVTLKTPVPQLRFDGIVVSRWAIDHSAGVLALINQQLLQDVPDPSKPRQDYGKTKNLGPCAFMRYDANLVPLTTFYSAFWDGPTGASLVASTPRATSQQPPPTSQIKLHAPTSTADPPPAPPTFKAGDANGTSNPRIVDFVDSSDKTLVWQSLCTLVATPVELIGREMFTGSISTETDGTALRYYADVAEMTAALKNTVTYTNGGAFTGICCIGADGTTVSNAATSPAETVTPTTTPPVPKNSSIALIGIVGGNVKHYFAGDADYRDDNAAADWISASVPVLKLGNHGSVVSAPLDLVTTMKPSHFICSVGPSLDQLHPRWELLIYLKAWADSASGGLKTPFFHPTSYPVYFTALDSTATPQLEFEFLPFSDSPTDDSAKRFQAEVNTLDSVLVTIIQTHAKNLSDGPTKTRWAIDFLRNLWPFMSYSTPEQHPITGAKAKHVTVSQQTQIMFIMAQLTKDDPVISYVNGGRKVVSKSTDSPVDPQALSTFVGYDAPPAGARKTPWFPLDADRQDTAPGGVILQTPYPFTGDAVIDSSTSLTWMDQDDETPGINLTTLIANGAFPEPSAPSAPSATTTTTNDTAPTTADPAPVYFLGVPAYDKGTTGTDTEILVSSDINTFISGLGPGFIGAPSTSGTLTVKDIWGYYMSVPFMNTDVTITSNDSTTTPKVTRISGISMVCRLFADKGDLTFSTAKNEAQFNTSNPDQDYNAVGAIISNSNVAIPTTGVVVCGLDPAATLTGVTFRSLMTTFNFAPEDDNSTLWKMIAFLESNSGSTLGLTLLAADTDTDVTTREVYRNAIWCFADTLFRFTIRLSFVVNPAISNSYISSVANYLDGYLGISGVTQKLDSYAKQIRFEVEMTGTYHPTLAYGYEVKTESVLRAIFPISLSSTSLEVTLTFSKAGFGIDIGCGDVGDVSNLLDIGAKLTDNNDIENVAGWLQSVDVFGLGSLPVPDNIWISRETGKTEYGVTFNFDALTKPVVRVGLSYNSSGVFTGALIAPIATANPQKLLPDYDIDTDPLNPKKSAASSTITTPQPLSITSLLGGGFTSLPNGIPDNISEAWVEYTHFGTDDNQVRIFGSITSNASTSASQNVPAIDIQVVSIAAQLRKKSKTDSADVVVNVSTTIQLNAAYDSGVPPAVLNASLDYDSSASDWIFHGRLESFQFSVLSSHFPAGVEQAFDDVLGKFLVRFVDITYTYEKTDSSAGKTGRGASSFFISGALDFGGLELNLAYQYISSAPSSSGSAGEIVASDPKSGEVLPPNQKPVPAPPARTQGTAATWKFDAWLGAVPGTTATVGSVLNSIDSSISSLLPDFVNSTPIPSASSDTPPISIEVLELTDGNGNATGVGFRAWVHLGDIAMTFIQKSERAGTSSTTTTTQTILRRILRISVATLPTAQKIPLVNELPQPFDTLEYMWVSTPDKGPAGFTPAEVTELNDTFLTNSNYPPILYKATKSSDDSKTGNDPSQANSTQAAAELVLVSGHHFRVIHNNEVVLDYPFGEKQFPQPDPAAPTPNTKVAKPAKVEVEAPALAIKNVDHKALVVTTHNAVAKDADPTTAPATSSDSSDAPVAKGTLSKTIGPLTISNIGVKLDSGIIWLTVDATITLGPLSFDLLGFGVGFDLTKADKGLSAASIEGLAASIQVQLSGMGLGFENPPITIAGVFNHDEQPGVNSYSGGVAVGFPPYTLIAVGEYDEVTNANQSYKSVFVFAKLDGPLVELEFATIEGVRLGFGYNNIVVTPDLTSLTSFPFISDSALGTSNDPMKVLAAVKASIKLQDGALWLAAGMSITAYDVLKITAVALLEFSQQGCDISLFCDGMASMPPDATPSTSIVYVEVVMIIELNVSQGFFRCEAALAPTSFILVPQCQLVGGFALCYWFGSSQYAGDFVFTIGGYHRNYTPPAHYPVPARIGFACKMGSNLAVTGEAYFAITPTCCMGGGHLHVQIDVGPISAYLDAYADFLITYKPFHYIADMGVDVGVTFDADFWIIHIHISCHVGAQLHIEGPQFGGNANVDFYLFSFTVYFGASPYPPPPLLLDNVGTTNGFYQICKLPGPGPQPGDQNLQNSTADPQMSNLHITLEAGAYTQGSSKTATSDDASNPPTAPGTKWKVRAGTFRFRITCDFAISSYIINNEAPRLAHGSEDKNPPAEADIFALPMHCYTPITSDLNVFIINEDTLNIPAPTATNPDAVIHVPSPTGTAPALTAAQLASIPNFDEQQYQPDFIIKSVPKALWASYLDPMISSTTNLLAGNKSSPTVNLAMGITVGAPQPLVSKDMINFAFNALDAMRANVFGAGPNEELDYYDPNLPAKGVPQSSWLSQPAPNNGVAAGWTEFQAAWTQSAELGPSAAGKGMLSVCMSALGWDTPPPGSKVPAGTWVLNGTLPSDLKSGLGSYYMTLPQIAGAA